MRKEPKRQTVHITNLYTKAPLHLAAIGRLTKRALAILRITKDLKLVFVSDTKMKQVNKLYHGTSQTTDVLAFEQPPTWPLSPMKKPVLGEIIISVDRVRVYAKEFHVTMAEELMRYVIHGILHLTGERDHSTTARTKMFAKQEKLIQSLKPIKGVIG